LIITFEPQNYPLYASVQRLQGEETTINAFVAEDSITFKNWPKEIQSEFLEKHCTGQKFKLDNGKEAYAIPYHSNIHKSIDDQFNKWERENTPNIEVISLHYAVSASNEYEMKSLIVQFKKVSKN